MLQRTERTSIYTKHLLENTLPITQKKGSIKDNICKENPIIFK